MDQHTPSEALDPTMGQQQHRVPPVHRKKGSGIPSVRRGQFRNRVILEFFGPLAALICLGGKKKSGDSGDIAPASTGYMELGSHLRLMVGDQSFP